MKKLLLSILSTTIIGLNAQPVMENNLPPTGSTYSLAQITGTFNEASTGADQVWDYSGVTTNAMASYIIVDPATLPASIKDSIPTATYGIKIEVGAPTPDLAPYDFVADKTNHYLYVGKKSSGSNPVEKRNDTFMVFNQAYNSSLNYGGMNRVYAGYGTLKVKTKTYNNIVMIKSYADGSPDTLVQFHQFVPYYHLLMTYAKMNGVIQNKLYFEITGGGGTTSINDLTTLQASVFPNPSEGNVSISIPGITESVVTFTDIRGREVKRFDHVSDNVILETANLEKGLYFVSISNKMNSQTIKWVKN